MDDDNRALNSLLTTRVGIQMEDNSVEALTCGRKSADEIETVLDELKAAVARMSSLITAAKAVMS